MADEVNKTTTYSLEMLKTRANFGQKPGMLYNQKKKKS